MPMSLNQALKQTPMQKKKNKVTKFSMEKFRQDLEEMKFPITLIEAAPLEDILLKPGIGRLRLLQWCFSHISNDVKERLLVNEDQLEDSLLEVAINFGLCSKSNEQKNVLLGIGSVAHQMAFWNKVFEFGKAVQGSAENRAENLNRYKEGSQVICEIIDSPDFEESLKFNINLVPPEMQICMTAARSGEADAISDQDGALSGNAFLRQLKDMREQRNVNPTAETSSFVPQDVPDSAFDSSALTRCAESYDAFYHREVEPVLPSLPVNGEQLQGELFHDVIEYIDSVRQHLDAFKDMLTLMEQPLSPSEYRHLESSFNNHLNQVTELNSLLEKTLAGRPVE